MNNYDSESRCVLIGRYVADKACTVRAAAIIFGVSKSTVHKDLTERLPREDAALFSAVREILETNKRERHIRGGNATKQKYMRGS